MFALFGRDTNIWRQEHLMISNEPSRKVQMQKQTGMPSPNLKMRFEGITLEMISGTRYKLIKQSMFGTKVSIPSHFISRFELAHLDNTRFFGAINRLLSARIF